MSPPRVVIAVLLVAGCGASPAQSTPRDPTPVRDVSAEAQAGAASSRGDHPPDRDAPPTVEAFLQAFAQSVRAGDIPTALSFCDPENRAGQQRMGIGDAHYLAEAIGLHNAQRLAGHDVPEPEPWDAAAELAAVVGVVIETVVRDDSDPGCVRAKGRVDLRDGRAYAFDLPVCPGGPRGFLIFPPVG